MTGDGTSRDRLGMRLLGQLADRRRLWYVSDEGPELRPNWRHAPLAARLSPNAQCFDDVMARHDAALAAGFASYADPLSGFSVFTADFLAGRSYCCESGCRHCPFAV